MEEVPGAGAAAVRLGREEVHQGEGRVRREHQVRVALGSRVDRVVVALVVVVAPVVGTVGVAYLRLVAVGHTLQENAHTKRGQDTENKMGEGDIDRSRDGNRQTDRQTSGAL